MATTDSKALEREVCIAARPETVFSFLTDPEKMARWMGVDVTADPRPEGIYRVDINGRDVARGKYTEVEPNSRIVFTWGWEGEDSPLKPGSTTVEILLIEDGDQTILRLRHIGLPAAQRDTHAEGWAHYLARLIMAAEGRDPGRDPWAATVEEKH